MTPYVRCNNCGRTLSVCDANGVFYAYDCQCVKERIEKVADNEYARGYAEGERQGKSDVLWTGRW